MIAPECTQRPSGTVKMTSRRRCVQSGDWRRLCAQHLYHFGWWDAVPNLPYFIMCGGFAEEVAVLDDNLTNGVIHACTAHALCEPIGVHGSKDGRTQDVKLTAYSPWRSFTRTIQQNAQRHISQLVDCHATAHTRPYLLTWLQRASLVVEHACTHCAAPLVFTVYTYSLRRSCVPCAPLSSTVVQRTIYGARSQCTSCASMTGVRSVCRTHAQVVIAGCMHDASVATVWLRVLLGLYGQAPTMTLVRALTTGCNDIAWHCFPHTHALSDHESIDPENALQFVA